MSRPKGIVVDVEPLELWEYTLLMSKLDLHWQLFYQLLWETGIRVTEALKLKRADFENNGIWVTRMKRKDRPREHLSLSLNLYNRIQVWLALTRRNTVFPFTSSAAWKAVKLAAQQSGVRTSIHPHSFRHGLGTRARQAGYDIAVVQRLLGHKSMSSTERYFKATRREVDDARRKLNKEV